MFDYGLSVMEQYDMEVQTSARGRGALYVRAGEGLFILQPYHGSRKRLEFQQKLLMSLYEDSGICVDVMVPNKEGELLSVDAMGEAYILRRWYEGRECDTRQEADILASAAGLAHLHKGMYLPVEKDYVREPLPQIYERHNRELRKIQRFIRKKGVQNAFERLFLGTVEEFLEYGQEAALRLEEIDYDRLYQETMERGSVCHGEYNQHHILLDRKKMAFTGFDKWGFGIQIVDLYSFMRKILEKYKWEPCLGEKMLHAYDRERPISDTQRKYLQVCFSYPEKYWKLANYYYTHNKAWISEKSIEKLMTITVQKESWKNFWKNYLV